MVWRIAPPKEVFQMIVDSVKLPDGGNTEQPRNRAWLVPARKADHHSLTAKTTGGDDSRGGRRRTTEDVALTTSPILLGFHPAKGVRRRTWILENVDFLREVSACDAARRARRQTVLGTSGTSYPHVVAVHHPAETLAEPKVRNLVLPSSITLQSEGPFEGVVEFSWT